MIGIIGFANLRIMQYLNKYTDVLDKHNIEYEIVYWNRELDGEKKNFKGNCISYDRQLNTYQPFYKKISGFIKYTRFMIKTIKKNKYDKLIVLTSQTAVPLYRLLLKKYKNKFIYDYRDITKERYDFYKKMVQKLINNSYFTALSSFGFKKVIGESDKFVKSHNCSELSAGECTYEKKNVIAISFWGLVRNVNYNKKICDALGNDPRFILNYHGDGKYREIQDYCLSMGYKNINFTGKYFRDEIEGFASKTDIIHCAYPNDRVMGIAMPVKLYDTVKYAKPIIMNKDIYMAGYMRPYNVSFDLDVESTTIADDIYNWYDGLDREELKKNFELLADKIRIDDNNFEEKLLDFAN